ncbi:MAG: hypothetical protein ABI459_06500 [Deltaproteobacteria bacterium]
MPTSYDLLKERAPFNRIEPRILTLLYNHHVNTNQSVAAAVVDLIEAAVLEVPVQALPALKGHLGQLLGILFSADKDAVSVNRRIGHLTPARDRLVKALQAELLAQDEIAV